MSAINIDSKAYKDALKDACEEIDSAAQRWLRPMSDEPTPAGLAALQPQPMTPEQVADLVARARVNEGRERAEASARRVASCKATIDARREHAARVAAELEDRKRYQVLMRGARR